MHDFIRDWRKWTRFERVVSVLLVIAVLIVLPALTTNLFANVVWQHVARSGIPS